MQRVVIIVFTLVMFSHSKAIAQIKYDYQWIFATDPEPLPGLEGSFIDFNNESIDTFYQSVNYFIGSNHAQICDPETGKLLFYTNGCHIFDRTHELMENGGNINPGSSHDNNCEHGYSGTQGSIIIPDPSWNKGYYLIHKKDSLLTEPNLDLINAEILFSYIEMTGNNGLGKVTLKNNKFFDTENVVLGYLTACKHKNGEDWWLIQMSDRRNVYYKILLNLNGPEVIDSQSIGSNFTNGSSRSGQSVFSPDGSKFIIFNPVDQAMIFDFDRSNGNLSNLRIVEVMNNNSFSGVAVSPNNRFVYLSTQFELYQVDLWEEDLQSSLMLIDTFDGFGDPFPTNFYMCMLGPDCRIYITSTNGSKYLHVINKPNEKGKTCEFWQHGLKLPFQRAAGLPNFPHFRIDEEDVCDPTITSLFGNTVWYRRDLKVWPNPSSGIFNIDLPVLSKGKIVITDINATLLESIDVEPGEEKVRIDISHLLAGLYNVEFYPEDSLDRVFYSTMVVKQ